ncbi:hypothetical protein E4U44_001111 [Claviceps purpurea]|nr:hypothetical protein E4U44_001111 [Claviceps purpurea]
MKLLALVSLITTLAGSIIAAIAWMQVVQNRKHPVEMTDEIAAYIHASIFSLLGLISLFGFVGSLVRHRGLVIAFSVGMAIHLGLSIASGVFTMYTIFRPNPATSVEQCIKDANPSPDLLEETKNICKTGMAVAKGVIVAIYVVSWILQLYSYFIVERYADQLEEEEMAKLAAIIPQQPQHPMAYVGYPHRFSYSAYSDQRRSFDERYYNRRETYGQGRGDLPPQQNNFHPPQQRPLSAEYAYQLPQSAIGNGARGKDASNNA